VFLGLGSNWPRDRVAMLRAARRELAEAQDIRVLETSALYESEPWEREPGSGLDEQTWYLNCVVSIETELSPTELLARLQAIEAGLGRSRPAGTPEAQRFAPRTIDIDILFYGDQVISVPDDLHVPHLLLHERAFVLKPLRDLAPAFVHPTLYHTVGELDEELEDDHAVRPGDYPPQWYA
jgi:2-amino-4-hydroxy-6-hydroxymethyldihydropteridine diphosphokinase